MTRLTRRSFFALALALSLAFAAPASAADPAAGFIKGLGDKALSSLTVKELPQKEREARVRQLLRSYFDVQTIGRLVLGTHWKTATAAERSEYFSLFEDMIVKTYAQRFAEYSGQSFEVGGTVKESEKDSTVSSKIIQQGGPPLNVKWRVRNSGGSMKVIDVIVEDVSMMLTQRSDFASVIQAGGGKVEALLKSLRERKMEAKK